MTDDADSWLSSRKATNQLLGFIIVVLASGFISINDGDYEGLAIVAKLLLALVLVGAIVLFLGWLLGTDGPNGDE